MSVEENKGPATVESATPKRDVSGAAPKRSPVPLSRELSRAILKAAREIRKAFPTDLSDSKAADRAARLFRSRLTRRRRPGRPRSPAVSLAARMKAQGKPWHKIYPRAIPDYWSLDQAERSYRRENLRRAVKARAKRKKRSAVTSPS